jgi:hypothetical protein
MNSTSRGEKCGQGDLAQVVEYLSSKCKAPSPTPNTAKNKCDQENKIHCYFYVSLFSEDGRGNYELSE